MTAKFRSKRASSLPHNSGPVPAKLAWGWPYFFAGAFEPAPTEFQKRARGAAALRAPLPRPSSAKVRDGPEGGVPQQAREVPHATVSRHRSPKGSHPMNATEIAAALSTRAEEVCRRYLPRGRKQGRYWTIGDTSGAKGRSLFVRLAPPGIPGKWTEYVAVRVMLRICDLVLSHRRLASSKQHNASAFVLNELAQARASLLTDAMTDRLKADGLFDKTFRGSRACSCTRLRPAPAFWPSSWSAIRTCA